MSEPTYRVNLCFDPIADYDENRWQARIRRVSDDVPVKMVFAPTMEEAFEHAQSFVRSLMQPIPEGRIVYLTEDGDILDPHEVQR